MTGTHEGELQGVTPKGERVAEEQSHWFRVVDDLGMLQQLGVVPF
jgi:hypothetical protein